jgi:hypothetical protein
MRVSGEAPPLLKRARKDPAPDAHTEPAITRFAKGTAERNGPLLTHAARDATLFVHRVEASAPADATSLSSV